MKRCGIVLLLGLSLLTVHFSLPTVVSAQVVSETASYLAVKDAILRADNTMACNVSVYARTNTNIVIVGQQVTVYTQRMTAGGTIALSGPNNPLYDTITMTSPITNAAGQATATIITSNTGYCTIVAVCNGVTFTENLAGLNPSFELSGGLATDAANWTEGGGTHTRNAAKPKAGLWSERSVYVNAGTLATTSTMFLITYGSDYLVSGWIFDTYTSANNQTYIDLNNVNNDVTLRAYNKNVWEYSSSPWSSASYNTSVLRLVTQNTAATGASNTAWFDCIRMKRSPTVTWVGDTISNGSFEGVDASGWAQDWMRIGANANVNISTTQAHTGMRSLHETRSLGLMTEVGTNRDYNNPVNAVGWLMLRKRGWMNFWYKAVSIGGAATQCNIEIAPMKKDLAEGGAATQGRYTFTIPPSHFGDGLWHEGWLFFDYNSFGDVKYTQPLTRITPNDGTALAEIFLDDFTANDTRDAFLTVSSYVTYETYPGELCSFNILFDNGGDSATKPTNTMEIVLPSYLNVVGENTKVILPIYQSQSHNTCSYVVQGIRDRYDTFTVIIREASGSVMDSAVLVIRPAMDSSLSCGRYILKEGETTVVNCVVSSTGTAKITGCTVALSLGPGILVLGGQNLVQDPGFEIGASPPDNWSFAGAWSTVSDTKHTGSRSIRISEQAASDSYAATPEGANCNMPVYPGAPIYVEAYCKTQALAGNAGIRLIWWDTSGNYVSEGIYDTTTTGTHNWEKLYASVTAPAGAFLVSYRCQQSGTGTVWFDDVVLLNTSVYTNVSETIPPLTSETFTWVIKAVRQTNLATASVFITTSNCSNPILYTTFQVGENTSPPAPSGALSVRIQNNIAILENQKVHVNFVRADYGYGISELKMNSSSGWIIAGKMPNLGKLVYGANGGSTQSFSVFATNNPETSLIGGNTATLTFRRTWNDSDGYTWNFAASFILLNNDDVFSCSYSAVCGNNRAVRRYYGPVFYAGEGNFKGHKNEALLPSMDWQLEGERTSNIMDGWPPYQDKYVPHPMSVGINMMTVREGDNSMGIMWHAGDTWVSPAVANTPTMTTAKFASPNFLENQDNHLLALMVPTVPWYIARNESDYYDGVTPGTFTLTANNAMNIRCKIPLIANSNSVLDVMDRWFSIYGMPDTPALPLGTYDNALDQCANAFTSSLWDTPSQGWYDNIPNLWSPGPNPTVRTWLYLRAIMTSNATMKTNIMSQVNRAGAAQASYQQTLDQCLRLGKLEQAITQAEAEVSNLMSGQYPDGGWRWFPPMYDKHWLLWYKPSAIGSGTASLLQLLKYARILRIPEAMQAGLKGLEYFDNNFGPGNLPLDPVPRGAQVWEVPQHCPDGYAGGLAAQCYIEGYMLTGNTDYIDKAVYWAKTVLPFNVYWTPATRTKLLYSHYPIMGTTWYTSSKWWEWTVQWCGMAAVKPFYYLMKYDSSYPWYKILNGVTIAGYRLQTSVVNPGCYPDGYSQPNYADAYYWDLSPSDQFKNTLMMMGFDPEVQTQFVTYNTQAINVTSGANLNTSYMTGDTLVVSTNWVANETAFMIIAGIGQFSGVRRDTVTLSAVTNLDTVAEGYKYDSTKGRLLVKMDYSRSTCTVYVMGTQTWTHNIDPYASDLRMLSKTFLANGAQSCSVTINCRDSYGNALENKTMTLCTSRGPLFDTVTYPDGRVTDMAGQVIAYVSSPFMGDDTFTVEYEGDIDTPANILPNSSFESGSSNPDSWTFNTATGSWFWTTDDKKTGIYSVKHATAAAGDNYVEARWGVTASETMYYVLPATKFLVKAWVRTTAAGSNAGMRIMIRTDGNTLAGDTMVAAITGVNPWTNISGYVTIPHNANYISCRLQSSGTGTVWFDDVQALFYPPIVWNCLSNASFEKGTIDNWNSRAYSPAVWTKSSDEAFRGSYSDRYFNPGGSQDDYCEQSFSGYTHIDRMDVTAGENYCVEQNVKTNLSSGDAHIRIIWWQGDAVNTEDNRMYATGSNPWIKLSGVYTVPAGIDGLMYRGQTAGAGTVWFDAMMLRRIPTMRFMGSRLDIISPSFTRSAGSASPAIKFVVKDLATGNTDTQFTGDVTVTTSSDSGFFWCSSFWVSKSLSIPIVNGVGAFTYRDGIAGNPVITVYRAGCISDTITAVIAGQSTYETASYMTLNSAVVPADGVNVCTVAVTVKDTYGCPVPGRTVVLTASRGGSDTIQPVSAVTSTAGQCTFTVRSTYTGWDTITALCDGKIIRRGVNLDSAVGVYHFDTDVMDYSNNQNNGAGQNGTCFSDGIFGSAAWFNGINNYISLSRQPLLSAGFTFEAWVRSDNLTGWQVVFNNNQVFIRKDNPAMSEGSDLNAFVKLADNSVEPRAATSFDVNTGAWSQMTATWDGSLLRMYGNGVLNATQGRSGAMNANTVTAQIGMGEQAQTNVSPWNGAIDEVRVYSRVLTDTEILNDYAGRTSLHFTGNIINIITPARTMQQSVASNSIAVEVRAGASRDTGFNESLYMSSSSAGGKFSLSGTNWADVNMITLSSGYGVFYYRDAYIGTPTITVYRPGYMSDTQTETITLGTFSETPSFITAKTYYPTASGTSTCTVTVTVRSSVGMALGGLQVTVYSSRGPLVDTITMSNTITDGNGMCTAAIRSSTNGACTITAVCQGGTITNLFGEVFEDLTAINNYWGTNAGLWSMSGGGYEGTPGAMCTIKNMTFRDFTAIFDYTCINTAAADNWGGVLIRKPAYANDLPDPVYNFFYRPYAPYEIGLWEGLGGGGNQVGSNTTGISSYLIKRRIMVKALGANIRWSLEGTEYLSWTDPTDPYLEGFLSFKTLNLTARYDNLRIYPVTLQWQAAAKIAFVTPVRITGAGTSSDTIGIQAQWDDGSKATGFNGTAIIITSGAGEFSDTASGIWSSSKTVQFVNGETYFCYRDFRPGTYTLTATSGSLPNTTQLVVISPGAFDETASFVVLRSKNLVIDGVSKCTVTVYVTDKYRNPIMGQMVIVTSYRKGTALAGYDTITPALAGPTDASGMCTAYFVSSYSGKDTITAYLPGSPDNTITLGFYYEKPSAMWDFEETGSSRVFSSDNLNGTLYNNPAWTNGRYGSCLQYARAVNQYVTVPDTDAFHMAETMSLECWFNVSDTTNYMDIIGKNGMFSMRRDNDAEGTRAALFIWAPGGVEPRAASAVYTTAGQWFHVVTVYESGAYPANNHRIYIDGSLSGQTARTGPIDQAANAFTIGTGPLGGAFDGMIDDVRVYNRALSAEEITANFSNRSKYVDLIGSAYKLKIISPARTANGGAPSDSVIIEVHDQGGNLVPTFSNTVSLAFSTLSGRFSASDALWQDTTIITVNSGAGFFYFADYIPGNPVLTVSRAGLQPDTQMQLVLAVPPVSETNSYVRPDVSLFGIGSASGISNCTVTVSIRGSDGKTIYGKTVTLYSNRGAQDTITPNPAMTNGGGNAVFYVKSSVPGDDTLTARCDGLTVTENLLTNNSFEMGGFPPAFWNPLANSGQWSVATDDYYDGSVSLRHSCSATNDNYAQQLFRSGLGYPYDQTWSVSGNTPYKCSGFIKTMIDGGVQAYWRVVWFNGAAVLGDVNAAGLTDTNPWTYVSGTVISPATADGVMFRCENRDVGTAWFDAARLQRVPTLTWKAADKIGIITPPRSVNAGTASNSICVRAMWNDGSTALFYNETATFTSSSAGGLFSATQNGTYALSLAIRMVNGETWVYYRDVKSGSPAVNVSASGVSDTDQIESISALAFNETASFIILGSRNLVFDGTTQCTINVFVTDKYRNPITGQGVTIYSSRGAGTDTLAQPGATDANGQCTGYISSSLKGYDTITARVWGQPNTITLTFYRAMPVGFWDFDETGSLIASTYNNACAGYIDRAQWSPNGKNGTCLSFSGANTACVSVPDNSLLDISGAITLEAWVNFSSMAETYPSIMNKELSYMMRRDASAEGQDFSMFVYSGGWEPRVDSAFAPNTGQWYHVVGTYDSDVTLNNMNIYVNGTRMGQNTRSGLINNTANKLNIGAGESYMSGSLDDVRVYNIALTGDEAAAYANGRQRPLKVIGVPVKVKFTTPARTVGAGVISDSIVVEVQDTSSVKVDDFDDTVYVECTSASGQFSLDMADWSPSNSMVITLSSGTAYFYYRDTVMNSSTITGSRAGLTSDTQMINVTQSGVSDTASQLVVNPDMYGRIRADGIMPCTVAVYVKNVQGKVVYAKSVTLVTSRGAAVDTVTPPNPRLTDAGGYVAFAVVSLTAGQDTITATADGITIRENMVSNPSFENRSGTNDTDCLNWAEGASHNRNSLRPLSGIWALWSSFTGAGGSYTLSDTIIIPYESNFYLSGNIWNGYTAGATYYDLNDVSNDVSLLSANNARAWEYRQSGWYSANYTGLRVRAATDASPAGSSSWFDAVRLKRVPTVDFIQDTITNPGFENLSQSGQPINWVPITYVSGTVAISSAETHSGSRSLHCWRTNTVTNEVGFNRDYSLNGYQGWLLKKKTGWYSFWYKAIAKSAGASIQLYSIPMTAAPAEATSSSYSRTTYNVVDAHIGDNNWHQIWIKFDYSDYGEVIYTQPALRIIPTDGSETADIYLDDITFQDTRDGFLTVTGSNITESPTMAGDFGFFNILVQNPGDSGAAQMKAVITLPSYLSPVEGNTITASPTPSGTSDTITWQVQGNRDKADTYTVTITTFAGVFLESTVFEIAPAMNATAMANRFIVPAGETAAVYCSVMNTGTAKIKGLAGAISLGSGLGLDSAMNTAISAIVPSDADTMTWVIRGLFQTSFATATVIVTTQNCETKVFNLVFQVSADTPIPAPSGNLNAYIQNGIAVLENQKIFMAVIRSDYGYGVAQLEMKNSLLSWIIAGKMPNLGRLVYATAGGSTQVFNVFAAANPETSLVPGNTATLTFRRTWTDSNSNTWDFAATFILANNDNAFSCSYSAVCAAPTAVRRYYGPIFYVGEGNFNGHKNEALFPAMDWQLEGEQSSNNMDGWPPYQDKYVMTPFSYTIPMMSIREGDNSIGVIWDAGDTWVDPASGATDTPTMQTAKFATPNFLENQDNHLLALMVPTCPWYIPRNESDYYDGVTPQTFTLPANTAMNIRAKIPLIANSSSVLDIMDKWFSVYGISDTPVLPRTYDQELDMCADAYTSTLWDTPSQGWKANIPPLWAPSPDADIRTWLYLRAILTSDPVMKTNIMSQVDRAGAAQVAGNINFNQAFRLGKIETAVFNAENWSNSIMGSQYPDGGWKWYPEPDDKHIALWWKPSVLGTNVDNLRVLLRNARILRNPAIRTAGMLGLQFLDSNFGPGNTTDPVPRGAQVWEVPQHCPDGYAGGLALQCYLEGYWITGNTDYLDKAVYWAKTVLPFNNFWTTPARTKLLYSHYPIMGTTWYTASKWWEWTVQWCGMSAVKPFYYLDKVDSTYPWYKIMNGITIAGYRLQVTDTDYGCYPDGYSQPDYADAYYWNLGPSDQFRNTLAMLGWDPEVQTTFVAVNTQTVNITAGSIVDSAVYAANTLTITTRYAIGETAFLLIAGVTKPDSVFADSISLPMVSDIDANPQGWKYDAGRAYVYVKVNYMKSPLNIYLMSTTSWVLPVSRYSSYLTVSEFNPPANGSPSCTVTVYVKDRLGYPLQGKQVTLVTARGPVVDTVTYPSGKFTDTSGICVVMVASSQFGNDTFTAVCDGNSITQNILNNASFEMGSPTSWGLNGAGWSVTTDTSYQDSRSIMNYASVASDKFTEARWSGLEYTDRYPVATGQTYYATVYCRTQALAGGNAYIRIIYWSDTGALLSDNAYAALTGTNPWTFRQASLTIPAGATQLMFRCQNGGAGTVWFDCAKLCRVPTVRFTDGKLWFVNTPFTVAAGTASVPIRIGVGDAAGNTETTLSGTLTLSSSSPSGYFSVAAAPWQDINVVTFTSGVAQFYYRDFRKGNPVISVFRSGASIAAQAETITALPASASASYITFTPYEVSANSISLCSVVITAKDTFGNPVINKSVTYATSRGGTDTIVPVSPQVSDANGQVTFTIASGALGQDTITSGCDTASIVKGANGYGAAGIYHMDFDCNDASGRGNNGSASGSPSWLYGRFGRAAVLDGSDKFILASQPQINSAFTIEAWVRPDNTQWAGAVFNNNRIFLRKDSALDGNRFSLSVKLSDESYQPMAQSIITANTGTWYHITGTWNGINAVIYVNGTAENTVARQGAFTSALSQAQIGAGEQTNPDINYWYGAIDEFRIYDRVLTGEEISASYAGRANFYFRAGRLKITSAPKVIAEGTASDSIYVEAQDMAGNKDASFSGTVVLTTSSATGKFSTQTPWADTTVVNITAGLGTFFFKDPNAGNPVITVTRYSLLGDSQTETVSAGGGAVKIVIVSSQFRIRAGDISPQITAVAEDAGNNTDITFNNTVSLTTVSNSGYFSVSNVSWANTTNITFAAGIGYFYYRDYFVSWPTITAQRAGLSAGTQKETIAITGLQITNTPGFTITSISTAPIMVRARDGLGNTAVNSADSVTLQSSSLKGKFSLSGTLWSDTTSVYLSAGSVVIFYKDKKGGNSIITVTRTDSWTWFDTQQETITRPIVSTSKVQLNMRSGETGSMPMRFWPTDTVEYTIYISNTGTETSTGNVIIDTKSFDTSTNNAVDYVYMDTNGYADTWAYTTDLVSWTTGNPASGASNIKGLRWTINSLGINASKAIKFRVRVK